VTLWDVFDGVAARFPDRVAVELLRRDRTDSLTYGELRGLALQRAAWLAARGLGRGDRCAILADNDAAWCATYLGILRLGAIAVPLDTNYSSAQVATILRDAGAGLIFVSERLLDVARAAAASADATIAPIHDRDAPAGGTALPPGAESRDPAVILYTSGTTADPKGVVLTHTNLIAERDAAFSIVHVTERDSVLGVLPLFHALAQLANLLLPFAVGARVVFLETLNSTELLRALSERQITIFACVPQFFYLIHQRITGEVSRASLVTRVLFRVLLAASFRLRRLGINAGPALFGKVHDTLGRQMRLFVTGGSKFDPAIGRDLYALGFTILQAYGLTETSGAATITSPHDAHLDTVGRVLPGQELQIFAPEDAALDGEIAIRGPIVMQGYFNRPDATAAVMRDGWFLTGDLGRMDASGRVTITGRKKEVIVLASGKNIYPEEIEAQYRQSAFVKEICVMGLTREGEPTTERLFAVVVPDLELLRAKRMVNAGEILRFEMEGQSIHLPAHKRVLGYDVWFDPLPRTTTGKLKRHEIQRRLEDKQRQAPAAATGAGGVDAQWTADPHVGAAVDMIRARARDAVVRRDSNLELDLGLDSMERVELLTELEQRFGVRVNEEHAHHIFTVEHLVEAVRPGGGAAPLADAQESWAVLLRDLPAESDPRLSGLLERRPLTAPVFFALARLLRLVLARTRVRGVEHLPRQGPYIISPNHQGYLDPFFVCGVLPFGVFRQLFFVGAAEYFETPFMARVARACNCVPVDPDANLVPAMKAGAFGLAHGKVLMLFPEGERSIDGTVKRFKKGGPILSKHLQVPIVPVSINGAYAMWPRNRAFNWRALLPWSGHRVRITFGEPFRADGVDDDATAAAALRQRVVDMWTEAEAEMSAVPVSRAAAAGAPPTPPSPPGAVPAPRRRA
jgi:long-chain acyl-CoA synthetase